LEKACFGSCGKVERRGEETTKRSREVRRESDRETQRQRQRDRETDRDRERKVRGRKTEIKPSI
jgi:hypothetical protein